MTAESSQLLRTLSALAGTELPEASGLLAGCALRVFLPGEPVFHQGEPDGCIRLLVNGLVKLAYEDPQGRAFTKSIVQDGEIFASMASLNGLEASFSAVALARSEVEEVPWRILERLAARHHAWETAARRAFMLYAFRKEQREFQFLTLSAAERWAWLCQHRPDLLNRVTQAELAAYIGVTPVGLSRLKTRGLSKR